MKKQTAILSDDDIERYLAERKPIPKNYQKWLTPTERKTNSIQFLHLEREVIGLQGSKFQVHIMTSTVKPLKFSIQLNVVKKVVIGLARLEGIHGGHLNKLDEGTEFARIGKDEFHIHTATARYLEFDNSLVQIGFALSTDRYLDFPTALDFFVSNYGFVKRRTGLPFENPPVLKGL